MKDSNNRSGNIPVGGVLIRGALDFNIPATITLTSSAGGREIALSNDGVNFFVPVYDATTANMITVSVRSPVRVFRLTGTVNDPWNVL